MATKTEVITLNAAYPHWTAKRLAAALGCSQEYINACRGRYGLDIPRERNRQGESVSALGHAARRAGLTVAKIETMGASR